MLAGTTGGVPEPIAHIAPDPLEDAFDEEEFLRALRRRRTGIKRALLDQSLISGVGNIYADEALWRARLHWARPTETLTRAEAARVLHRAPVRSWAPPWRPAARPSTACTSTSTARAATSSGRSTCTGGEDEPCARCGSPIRRDAFMNRSSYTCPTCQPRPRRARF